MTFSRLEWLRQRQRGVFSSDVADLCGIGFNGLDGPAKVYADKIAPEPVESNTNERMRLGTFLEPYIAARFVEETGIRVVELPGISRNADNPWMGATLDRETADGSAAVEMKSSCDYPDPAEWGETSKDNPTDAIPEKYILQTQWQMGVTGHTSAWVPAYFVGSHLRIYRVQFNADLFGMLAQIAGDFWLRVKERAGIDGWKHGLTDAVVTRSQRIDPAKTVHLDDVAQAVADRYAELGRIEREAKEGRDDLKATLIQMMGAAALGVLPDGRRPRRKIINRAAYTVEASTYCDFRILGPEKVKGKR